MIFNLCKTYVRQTLNFSFEFNIESADKSTVSFSILEWDDRLNSSVWHVYQYSEYFPDFFWRLLTGQILQEHI